MTADDWIRVFDHVFGAFVGLVILVLCFVDFEVKW